MEVLDKAMAYIKSENDEQAILPLMVQEIKKEGL